MKVKRDNFCFACGKENPRGLKMDIKIDSDGACCEYKIPADLQGWQGFAHGGIISTMLDEIMVWAAAGRDIVTVTAEMRVRFRNPLPTDHTITLEGKVTDERKRLIIAQAKAFDEETVYAEAKGKLFRVP